MRSWKCALPAVAALAMGAMSPAAAQTTELRNLPEGTPVVVLGVVSSPPKGAIEEKKMQVAIGPNKTDYTLHFRDAQLFGAGGKVIDEDGFDNGQWVRAEGYTMDDSRRIRVDRVEVLGKDLAAVRASGFFRSGFEQGYAMATGKPVTPAVFSQNAEVVVVGPITSPPKGAIEEKKMQVAIGPGRTDYTLHFKDAQLIGPFGQKIDEDGLDDGMWVRATGRVMDDPRRIKVSRVQVIGKDVAAVRASGFYRAGYDLGYVSAVAGSREVYPAGAAQFTAAPVMLVGQVTDDTGRLETTRKLQVSSAGNEWTLNVADDASVMDQKGEKISVHEVSKGQWIRATGWQIGDLRMRVARVENIGSAEAFRGSKFFRQASPLGYLEYSTGEGSGFNRVVVSGTVTGINRDLGYVTLRDAQGRSHRVYTDSASISARGQVADPRELRVGDTITVEGRTVQFK